MPAKARMEPNKDPRFPNKEQGWGCSDRLCWCPVPPRETPHGNLNSINHSGSCHTLGGSSTTKLCTADGETGGDS